MIRAIILEAFVAGGVFGLYYVMKPKGRHRKDDF